MNTALRQWRVLGAALIIAALVIAAFVIAALVANVVKHLDLGDFALFDTLGYFSQQGNILAAILLLVVARYTGRRRPSRLVVPAVVPAAVPTRVPRQAWESGGP